MVSWKSADESIADATLDDYVLDGQIDAIDTIRDLLGVESVHAIGYCVAGTTLAATLAYLAGEEARRTRSSRATFFTAQVDFSEAGDLKLFLGDETMALLEQLTAENGVLDGRYMAATFNLLRGRDLIWNYVVNNYLLGKEPPPFDLLHWNSDATNLPAGWHRDYLETLYKGNKLAEKGGIEVAGTPDRHRPGEDARPTSRPGARTISRRRRACGRSWTISPGRSASCSPGRAISPAWSTRRRRRNINIGSTTGRAPRSTNSSPARPSIRAAGGRTGSNG